MSAGSEFRLLVITDIHYAPPGADGAQTPRERVCRLGRELVRRAVEDARRRGEVHAIALLGDLVNDGTQPYAAPAVDEIIATLADAGGGAPLLIAAGNHDYAGERLPEGLAGRSGVIEAGGYRFVVFADPYVETTYCTRCEADRQRLRHLGAAGGPIVALQHNPMNPAIDCSDYPFMLTNREQVMDDYAAAGVMLSISGHYHSGQPLSHDRGVAYFTAPALCEAPYRYAILTLRGRDVSCETFQLRLPETPRLWDTHAHTEFAYCGRGISAEAQIDRAAVFGLAGVCLVEHGPQLYVTADDFWNARHVRDRSTWRGTANSRVAEFRRRIEPLRAPTVRVGLEVEVGADGELILREEDREWPDLLVGAVHWLPRDEKELTDAEFVRVFMDTTEALLTCGVDVLAHPWRIFRWRDRKPDKRLYGDLADMLAATGAAAEINCHKNAPDPDFFAECIRRGVKITLGSDAHEMHEAAAFAQHLDILRKAAGRDDVADLLFDPLG